ncbi:hypothetical protein V9L05_18375 [Bernardetia sp. Wsw4-3y2]|uniref:hypothetical protein n=1 Tax=Bernardetia sp. Wsw4-3y2 TaxID=3127471 RepID=UPI0030CF7B49
MPNIFTLTAPSIGYKKSISITILDEKNFTIAYVLPDGNFKGGYGIDWCEIKDAKIEKFQDVKPSEISHIFDETSNTFISDGITEDKREELIKALYATTKINEKGFVKETAVDAESETTEEKDKLEEVDYIPTWINLPEGETVKVEVKFLVKGEERKNGYITFKKNENFEITKGKDQDDNIRLEKLVNGKSHDKIYIKALTTFSTPQDIILVDDKGIEVGKIEMEANNIVELGVRIIPVVIASTNENAEKKKEAELKNAVLLRETALKATERDNKLNKGFAQAGIKCVIEPAKEPKLEYIVIDPSKARNKVDSAEEADELAGHYYEDRIIDIIATNNQKKPAVGEVSKIYKDVGMFDKEINSKLVERYKELFDASYKGAIVFVTDQYHVERTKEGLEERLGGVSSSSPLEYQGVLIFTTDKSDIGITHDGTYIHELGHMLGLAHPFADEDTNDNSGEIRKLKVAIQEYKDTIVLYKKKIEEKTTAIALYEKQIGEETEAKIDPDFLETLQDNIASAQDDIAFNEKIITNAEKDLNESLHELNVYASPFFKITKGKTTNYMDYDNTKTYFFRFQSKMLKREVSKYYA